MNESYKPIPVAEIAGLMQGIEKGYPVSEWTMGGLRIWPLLRIPIAAEIRNMNYPPRKAGKKSIVKPLDAWKAILHDRRKAGKLISYPGRVVIFGDSTGKTRTPEGYYSQYVAPLSSFLGGNGIRSIVVERDLSGCKGLPRKTPSLYVSFPGLAPVLDTIDTIKIFMGRQHYLPGLDEVSTVLSEYCDVKKYLYLSRIRKRYKWCMTYSLIYSLLLRIIKPSCVIVQCFYNIHSMAAVLACRKMKIPSYDYQHGVQGESHYAYGEWKKLPAGGYELLPDGYLVWDEFSAKNLKSYVAQPDHVHVIGNLWHDYIEEIVPGSERTMAALKESAAGRPIILYTLQDFEPPRWILDIIKESASSFWLIRMHPQYTLYGDYIRSCLGDAGNYSLDEASDAPLPLLLGIASAHVTGCSSVVIEAASVGMRSAVTSDIGKAYYKDLVDEGVVEYAPSPESLSAFLQSGKDGGRVSTRPEYRKGRDSFIDSLKRSAQRPFEGFQV